MQVVGDTHNSLTATVKAILLRSILVCTASPIVGVLYHAGRRPQGCTIEV